MKRPIAIVIYALVAGIIVASDLWSKDAAFTTLDARLEKLPEGGVHFVRGFERPVFDGWLSLEASRNFGAFSGWFQDYPAVLLGVSVLAVLVTLGIVAFCPRASRILVVSLGLLAGGALGNLYDRLVFGAVRDFIKVYYGDWVWPNFNVADSAICTGVGLLFLREFLLVRHAKRERDEANPTPEPPAAG